MLVIKDVMQFELSGVDSALLTRQDGLTYHRWVESRSAPASQSRGVIDLRRYAGVGDGREKRVWRAQAKLRGGKRTKK